MSPLVMAAFMYVTSPDKLFYSVAIVLLLLGAMAHVIFWLAYFATKVVRARTNLGGVPASAAIFALMTFVLSCLGYVATYFIAGGGFSWPSLIRDSASLALSGAAAYVLYCVLAPGFKLTRGISGA